MNAKALTLAVAAILALTVSAGGVAATDNLYSLSDEQSDELPDEYDLTVHDPDGVLTDELVDTAIALTWQHDDVQAAFDGSDSYEITVQATNGLDDVTVVIDGDGEEASGADVDLENETVTDALSGDQIRSADAVDTVDVTSENVSDDGTIAVSTQDDGETVTVSEDDIDVDVAPAHPLADAEFDVVAEDGLLGDDEASLLEDLVSTDSDVDEHVTDLLDRENETVDVEEWTLTVSEYESDVFAPADEPIVEAELSYDGTDEAVSVYVNLEDGEVVNVVPVRTLDTSDVETIDLDEVDLEITDPEESETNE